MRRRLPEIFDDAVRQKLETEVDDLSRLLVLCDRDQLVAPPLQHEPGVSRALFAVVGLYCSSRALLR